MLQPDPTTTQQFIVQSYPLYAVTMVRAEDPLRFELTPEPIRLVLGWTITDDGKVLPMLEGSPAPTLWNGAVLYAETRKRAEATAKRIDKADRVTVRHDRVARAYDRVTERMARSLERIDTRLNR